MEQQWILKQKNVSFEEQYHMTAEERQWWIKQIQEENERMKRASRGSREL